MNGIYSGVDDETLVAVRPEDMKTLGHGKTLVARQT